MAENAQRRRADLYGPLPTIEDSKRLGMTGLRVYCSSLYCHLQRRVEFEALALPDHTLFHDIPKLRQFVCPRCGGFQVTVGEDWKECCDAWQRQTKEAK